MLVAEGTDMLVFQAGSAVQLMTGRTLKTDVARGAIGGVSLLDAPGSAGRGCS